MSGLLEGYKLNTCVKDVWQKATISKKYDHIYNGTCSSVVHLSRHILPKCPSGAIYHLSCVRACV